jgi:heat-inducible transcriptional repressor
VVLILSSGRVEQRLVELAPADRRGRSRRSRARLPRPSTAGSIAERPTLRPSSADRTTAARRQPWRALVDAMSDHRSAERVARRGAANLARFGDSFELSVRPLLEALEEHVVLLKLLGEARTGGRSRSASARGSLPGVRQHERRLDRVRPGDEAVGNLGVVGPTRMDYPGTMAAVRAVARYVSRILDEA